MLDIVALKETAYEYLAKSNGQGFALAVLHNYELMYTEGFGTTSAEDGGTPITEQTLFRIGSTSKPVTGTVIMRMVEEGRLALDLSIKQYALWLRFFESEPAATIALRMGHH